MAVAVAVAGWTAAAAARGTSLDSAGFGAGAAVSTQSTTKGPRQHALSPSEETAVASSGQTDPPSTAAQALVAAVGDRPEAAVTVDGGAGGRGGGATHEWR